MKPSQVSKGELKDSQKLSVRFSPEATVIPIWKTAICKWGIYKWGILKCPVFNVLNFRGWIQLIYDKITLIYFVKNAFNPASEVQNIENGVFQNALFANAQFANGRFPNGDYSCLWAKALFHFKSIL